MRYLITLCCIVFVFGLPGCSSDPVSPIDFDNGTFQQEGISDTVRTLNTGHGLLLAGTNAGAYKKSITTQSGWNPIGLQVESADVVDFIISSPLRYIAALNYEGQTDGGKPVLFETRNGGDSWSSISVTHDNELRIFQVLELEKDPKEDNHFFADAGGTVMKSTDGGQSWSNIYSGSFAYFLNLSDYHPQQLWVGGQTNIFSPYLAMTQDGGQNWTMLSKQFFSGFNTETIVQDAILHPGKSSHVLVGAGGAIAPANVIRKSTDGGQSWQTVMENINAITLAHSTRTPTTVYASGRNSNGNLFFVASNDFGDSWEQVEWEEGPSGAEDGPSGLVQVNDMVSVMENGREVLYFGTNQGVYSYRFEE